MSTDTPEAGPDAEEPKKDEADASTDTGKESKPAKKPAAKRAPRKKKTEPVTIDATAEKAEEKDSADDATAEDSADTKTTESSPNMQWDKAKETLAQVDWDSRIYHLKRFLMMILAFIVEGIARLAIGILAIAQFLYVLITLERIKALSDLSGRIASYVHELWDFIGYHSDEAVYPFAPFPEASTGNLRADEESQQD